jgi:Domain of unknown function (DUF222)
MGWCVGAQEARGRIWAALDAIDAGYAVLRETSSDEVGNDFRVAVAERLETQERTNRGLMYRFFEEIAEPPDGGESIPAVREALRARLRAAPREVVRRFKLAARIRPRRSLTGPPVAPELPELAAAVEAGAVGEDHICAVCHALDVLPACVSPTDVTEAERTLVAHAGKLDAGIVVKLGRLRRPHWPATVSGPPKTPRHHRPEAHLLRARSRLHPPQLPRIGISVRGAPFTGLGTRRAHRCGQAVLRLRLRPRRREPRRLAHHHHRQRPTRLDQRQRPTRNQPRPPPRRTTTRRPRPARSGRRLGTRRRLNQ